mgnify:CR=1 FL=1
MVHKEAEESFKKSIALKPDYAEVARNLVKLPIGSIDEKTISKLNKKLSLISANIDDQSQKLFFEANLFSHKGMYEEAFKIFVDANSLKSEENILSRKRSAEIISFFVWILGIGSALSFNIWSDF